MLKSKPPIQLHPKRFLAAAICTSAAFLLTVAVDLASPEIALPHAAVGIGRAACVTLWILWFVARGIEIILTAISRRSAAYAIGYVEGVTGRYPHGDSTDLARVTDPER